MRRILVISSALLTMASIAGLVVSAQTSRAARPGENGKIAFCSDRDGSGNLELYVMNADGSNQTRLTNDPGLDCFPAWSPGGTTIAFTSSRDGHREVYVMNADGSGQTRLTNTAFPSTTPSWSPDGKRIAFWSRRDGNAELYVMNANGSNQTRLTNDPADDFVPTWSPDGKKILFDSTRDNASGKLQIWVMNADGSQQTRLTFDSKTDFTRSWSPDGKHIVFTNFDVNLSPDGTGVYVMNAHGKHIKTLMSARADDAAWSPDGTKIAFDGDAGGCFGNPPGNCDIFVMKVNGRRLTNLTNNPAVDIYAAWQPIPRPARG